MKKLLGSTLALAMFLPTGANAELLKNLKISGQLDVTAVSAHNTSDFITRGTPNVGTQTNASNDRISHAFTRTMLSADWDLLDDVHARVTLVKGGNNTLANGVRVYGSDSESVSQWQERTFVQEAHVKIDKLMSLFDTTIGRQFYGEQGDLIAYYGPRDNYGFTTDALDAFRFDWKGEHMTVTGMAGRMAGGDAGPATALGNETQDIRAIVASCNQHEMVKPTVYIYNKLVHAAGSTGTGIPNNSGVANGKNDNLYVVGAKAKIAAGGLSAHVEYAKNFGDDRTTFTGTANRAQTGKYTGSAILLKLGYKADIADVAAVNPWAELGRGTGDANYAHAGNRNFQSINTDYRPGGIYGRFNQGSAAVLGANVTAGGPTNFSGQSNGLSNRTIWGFGVKATPAMVNKLTTGLAYYRYAFTAVAPESNSLNTAQNGVKPSRNIGSEVDFTAEWKHSDNVGVNVTIGQFLPGAYVAHVKGSHAALNPARMYAADVKIRF